MQERTYGWTTEMMVKAARRGLRIMEVRVGYRERGGGKSKVSDMRSKRSRQAPKSSSLA